MHASLFVDTIVSKQETIMSSAKLPAAIPKINLSPEAKSEKAREKDEGSTSPKVPPAKKQKRNRKKWLGLPMQKGLHKNDPLPEEAIAEVVARNPKSTSLPTLFTKDGRGGCACNNKSAKNNPWKHIFPCFCPQKDFTEEEQTRQDSVVRTMDDLEEDSRTECETVVYNKE